MIPKSISGRKATTPKDFDILIFWYFDGQCSIRLNASRAGLPGGCTQEISLHKLNSPIDNVIVHISQAPIKAGH